MRKHNEGYVLIYVLVVMVVMGLVATGVLTVSLNNYRAQQAAGQRMQELYEAEGIAEMVTATLNDPTISATYTNITPKPEPAPVDFSVNHGNLLLSSVYAAALEYANMIDKAILGVDVAERELVVPPDWTDSVVNFYVKKKSENTPISFYDRDTDGQLIISKYLPIHEGTDSAIRGLVDGLIGDRGTELFKHLAFVANDDSEDSISYSCDLPYYAEVKSGSSLIQTNYTVSFLITAKITKEEEKTEEDTTTIETTIEYGISNIHVQYESYEISTGVGA